MKTKLPTYEQLRHYWVVSQGDGDLPCALFLLECDAMCYDLNEYDPFHPRYELDYDGSEYIADEPMEEWDWEEFLDFNEKNVDNQS